MADGPVLSVKGMLTVLLCALLLLGCHLQETQGRIDASLALDQKVSRHILQTSVQTTDVCGPKCGYRCSKASGKKYCLKDCNACCVKCGDGCVPSGTYGNKEECPCYNSIKNTKGQGKCP